MTFPTAEFTLNRSMPLAPGALWHILTDPKEREAWGAPDESMVLTVETSDMREGGFDRHRCGPVEEPMFFVETRWYRLETGQAACFTETVIFEGARAFTSLVTYRLAQEGTGTALEVNVAVTSFDDESVFAEVEGGWTGALDRLQSKLVAA